MSEGNNWSTADMPSIDEMVSIVRRFAAQRKVSESRATFAALATVCPVCREPAEYDESSSTFRLCIHQWAELQKLPQAESKPSAFGFVVPSTPLDGIRVTRRHD